MHDKKDPYQVVELIDKVAKIDDQLGYGPFDMIIEEVGELSSAMQKYNRGRDNLDHVIEESTDVIVTIFVMLRRKKDERTINVYEKMCEKLERTIERYPELLDEK